MLCPKIYLINILFFHGGTAVSWPKNQSRMVFGAETHEAVSDFQPGRKPFCDSAIYHISIYSSSFSAAAGVCLSVWGTDGDVTSSNAFIQTCLLGWSHSLLDYILATGNSMTVVCSDGRLFMTKKYDKTILTLTGATAGAFTCRY